MHLASPLILLWGFQRASWVQWRRGLTPLDHPVFHTLPMPFGSCWFRGAYWRLNLTVIQVCQMFFPRGASIRVSLDSHLTGLLTRSRWRVDTSARRTSLPCRWRWSWPAAGRRHMLSCREWSPEPCRSSQTSSCRPHRSRLHWRFHLRWWTLTGKRRGISMWCREREKKTQMGWHGIGSEAGQRGTQTHLAIRCRLTSREDRMGCAGCKLGCCCRFGQHLERSGVEWEGRGRKGNELTCRSTWWRWVWRWVSAFTCLHVRRILRICTHCAAERENKFIIRFVFVFFNFSPSDAVSVLCPQPPPPP